MTQDIAKGRASILVVDDDHSITATLSMLLTKNDYFVVTADCPAAALEALSQNDIALVLLDMNFSRQTSGQQGLELLQTIKLQKSNMPVILMTAWGSIELAVSGMKNGASDFITKPWNNTHILRSIKTAIDLSGQSRQTPVSRAELDQNYRLSGLIGEAPNFVSVLNTLTRVANTNAPVLILGESGTGKELIAEAIHANSDRAQYDMVKVNLGGMSSSLFESEMFGHVKGAFTDAKRDRTGRFELGNNSTIFLDELGDLDPSSQVKLLRVLQDQTFQAVGSSEVRRSDVRVVSATNKSLVDLVERGVFREDLFYRVNLITIKVPPLRERRSDIPLLAEHQLRRIEQLYNLSGIRIDSYGLAWLEAQKWPGNVRQLLQTIERAVLMSDNKVLSEPDFKPNNVSEEHSGQDVPTLPVGAFTLNELEKLMIEKSMEAYEHNITKVAEALGISRAALYRRLEKHQLDT